MSTLVAVGIFAAASIGVVVFMPLGPWRQWLFYTLRSIWLLALVLRMQFEAMRGNQLAERALARSRGVLIAVLVLLFTTVAEDTYAILLMKPPTAETNPLLVAISYRNIADNLLTTTLSAFLGWRNLKLLKLHFEQPAGLIPEARAKSSGNQDEPLHDYVAAAMPAFAERFGLTERESEICALFLEGLNTRQIAQKLYVVEGTVKTHIHNVRKKSGCFFSG